MNEKVYMHGINNYGFREYKVLRQILSLGALLSIRNQGIKYSSNFSGFDYISLCDYEKKECFIDNVPSEIGKYNGYYQYIIHNLSLSFRKNEIDAIIPKMVEYIGNYERPYDKMKEYGLMKERYSDLADEVQVKDKVSLNHLEQVTFPTMSYFKDCIYLSSNSRIKALTKEIKKIEELLKEYNYNVPIYDIETKKLMNEENIEQIVLSLK